MATAVKRLLSASTDGEGILVATSSSPGTLVHTAVASTIAGTYDEIWLFAYNSDSANQVLFVQIGSTGLPRKVQIDAQQGLVPVLPGLILQNAKTIRVWGSVANIMMVDGFVNRITD